MPPRTLEQRVRAALPLSIPFDGFCFRNVSQQFATSADILSTRGNVLKGGRYNLRGAFGVLYLSCGVHTCIEETTMSFQRKDAEVADLLPRTLVGVEVHLTCVLDLTSPRIRRRLGVTKRELVETDWEYVQNVLRQEALTQRLGRFARDAGFEALLVPSAALPRKGKNLDIFPDRLLPPSSLRVVNVHQLTL